MSEPGTTLAAAGAVDAVHVPLNGKLDNVDQAWRLAKIFAQAKIISGDLQNNPANTFLVILYGQRLGIPPEIAINVIKPVKGNPRMMGNLLLAKVREAGHTPKIVHGKDECTVTITRGDTQEEHTESFTIDEAIQANLCRRTESGKIVARSENGNKPLPWEQYTKRMLMWRALGFCVDVICPEIKMGFVVEGELDQEPIAEPRTLAQVAAERMDQQPATAEPAPSEEHQQAVLEAELARLASEHTGDTGDVATLGDDPEHPVVPAEEEPARPAPDYVCDICSMQGAHFQDVCPDLQHPAEEVGP